MTVNIPLPTFEDLYDFLRKEYKHSRFEGRNDADWGTDYSVRITQNYMNDLKAYGWAIISHHESIRNQQMNFDRSLTILNLDEPPIEYPTRTGHLTHLLD